MWPQAPAAEPPHLRRTGRQLCYTEGQVVFLPDMDRPGKDAGFLEAVASQLSCEEPRQIHAVGEC
jgi:hypothetical protein